MGKMKDLYIERMNEGFDGMLARKLGLTYDELIALNHRIDTEESKDGLIYNYIVSFDENAPQEILDKVEGLDSNNTVWFSPWQFEDEDENYYEEQYDAIISNKEYYETFLQAISSSKKLNEVSIDDLELMNVLKRQVYVSVMTAFEAFLSETFINLTDENDDYFRNFIETFPDFKETKIKMSRIFSEQERLKETAKKVMVKVLYHNLAKVGIMYSSTFKIDFPDIKELSKCVSIRHDLVHRNGKTTKGETVTVDEATITKLIKSVTDFTEDIARKLELINNNSLEGLF